jgi:hypothetical protein
MTGVAVAPAGAEVRPRRLLHIATPALISIATLIVLTAVISWGWGQPDRFGSVEAYRGVMDIAVLARLGPAFMSGVVVYPAMRLRGASIGWAGAGAVASALAFGVIGALQALTFFPPAQAAYYVINPMVVGAIGSQVAWCAVTEPFVRWRRGGRAALTSVRLWAVVAVVAVAGFSLLYIGVIWDGGRHWFYVWIRGFMFLFGTGQ